MSKTRQPNLVFFFFFFFFTLHIATQTTGSVKCNTGSLRYPFGFSNSYPIRLNCSKVTGDAENGEFVVEEVTNSNIYVKIPSVCKRKTGKIEQLFRENLAPSTFNNIILVQGCKEQLSNCSTSIPKNFVEDRLNLSSCNIPVSCLDGATTTADVLSIGDVVNRSGCTYWFSSSTKSEYSVHLGRLMLDWWLKEGCYNTTCSENADCTDVNLGLTTSIYSR